MGSGIINFIEDDIFFIPFLCLTSKSTKSTSILGWNLQYFRFFPSFSIFRRSSFFLSWISGASSRTLSIKYSKNSSVKSFSYSSSILKRLSENDT